MVESIKPVMSEKVIGLAAEHTYLFSVCVEVLTMLSHMLAPDMI